MEKATIDSLRDLNTACIDAAIAGEVLGVAPQGIREQAKRDPSKLGFPVIVIKHRVKIPRIPFIQFMTGEEATKKEAK